MSTLALYRKYRPASFSEVIGQEHVTEPLISALRAGKLHHAYLFSGPRGCGKTSSARILARSLNCTEGPTANPCGVCDSCVSLSAQGRGSLDVIEIDAASHGGVDDARELRERAFFAPVNARYKIYIVDEAHMVSSAGFNALLKLVEEPPKFVVFVFATTEPDKVLTTIRSRTHHYPFRLVPPGVLQDYVAKLCQSEGARVEPAVFPLVVRAGGGSVRDTLSIMDQLLSGAEAAGVTYERALALLGVTDSSLIDEACDALAAQDCGVLLGVVEKVTSAGHDPRRFASDLLERLRDLLVLDKVPAAVEHGLVHAPQDQLEKMVSQALRLGGGSGATLSRMADILSDAVTQMRGTTSPRLLLELACARMLLPSLDDSSSGFGQRMERLERRLAIGVVQSTQADTQTPELSRAPSTPQIPPAPSVVEEPANDPPPDTPRVSPRPTSSSSTVGIDDIRRLWPDVLERLKERRVVWSLMQNVTPVSVAGNQLTVAVHHEGLVRRVNEDAVAGMVSRVLNDLLGFQCELVAHVAQANTNLQTTGVDVEGEAKALTTNEGSIPHPRDDDDADHAQKKSNVENATEVLERVLGAKKE